VIRLSPRHLLASLLLLPLLLTACGGSEVTPEERAARQVATDFYTAVGKGQWERACGEATNSYTQGVGSVLVIIDSLNSRIAKSGKAPVKVKLKKSSLSCPKTLAKAITLQSPIAPGEGYPGLEITGSEVADGTVRVEANVSNKTYFGNRSGKGESPKVFVLIKVGDRWQVNSVDTPVNSQEDPTEMIPG
jgi:hypothetical protein